MKPLFENRLKNALAIAILTLLAVAVAYAGARIKVQSRHTASMAVGTDTIADGYSIDSGHVATGLDCESQRVGGIVGHVIVDSSKNWITGFGTKDTCYIVLHSFLGGRTRTIDSVKKAGLPCTLYVADQATSDTMLLGNPYIWWYVKDSTNDTTYNATYIINWKLWYTTP